MSGLVLRRGSEAAAGESSDLTVRLSEQPQKISKY